MGEHSSKMAAPVIVSATAKHTATVIFLHGLGDTGHGWASTMPASSLAHIKFVCPTASVMPVTLNAGYPMPSWFDLKSLDVDGEEDKAGIKKARDGIHQLIEQEAKLGIPYSRIVLGGFSQGGALALYSSLTYKNTLAGVVALSCWMPLRSEFPAGILGNSNTPILQCHGKSDSVVPYNFGELTSKLLTQFIPNLEFKTYKNLSHSSSTEEMKDVEDFINKCVPAE